MDKVKVNMELGNAIESAMNWFGGDKERILSAHGSKGNWSVEVHKPLNELTPYKLAEILIKGFEVEEAPKDKVLHAYRVSHNIESTSGNIIDKNYSKGFKAGIKYVNKEFELGLKLD